MLCSPTFWAVVMSNPPLQKIGSWWKLYLAKCVHLPKTEKLHTNLSQSMATGQGNWCRSRRSRRTSIVLTLSDQINREFRHSHSFLFLIQLHSTRNLVLLLSLTLSILAIKISLFDACRTCYRFMMITHFKRSLLVHFAWGCGWLRCILSTATILCPRIEMEYVS